MRNTFTPSILLAIAIICTIGVGTAKSQLSDTYYQLSSDPGSAFVYAPGTAITVKYVEENAASSTLSYTILNDNQTVLVAKTTLATSPTKGVNYLSIPLAGCANGSFYLVVIESPGGKKQYLKIVKVQ